MTTHAPLSLILLVRVFAPFAAGYFLSYLYRVVNAVIAPDLIADVGLTAGDLGLLTSAYFLSFAAFQLPLGLLLDRFGPRRTEAALLLFAAAGAWVFSTAESAAGLVAGRALIGFGVSACLMAAFKAFVDWFPAERLPMVNGFQMAAGGLGALSATAPVEAALAVTDWRGVFAALAVLTLAVAALVFLAVPERPEAREHRNLRDQLGGIGEVFTSRLFWSVAPWTVASQATFLSVQGLWAGPWLRDVAALERAEVATALLLIAASMVVGFILVGMIAERLGRIGVPPLRVAAAGMGLFMVAQGLLIAEWTAAALPLWMAFGFLGTAGIVPYAALSQRFAPHLAGRVNTGLNLLVFVAAFAAQWGMGAVIGIWPETAVGGYAPAGYQAAFAVMLAMQAAGMAWFAIAAPRR